VTVFSDADRIPAKIPKKKTDKIIAT
jgi:hypothetical protein